MPGSARPFLPKFSRENGPVSEGKRLEKQGSNQGVVPLSPSSALVEAEVPMTALAFLVVLAQTLPSPAPSITLDAAPFALRCGDPNHDGKTDFVAGLSTTNGEIVTL